MHFESLEKKKENSAKQVTLHLRSYLLVSEMQIYDA